MRGVGCCCVERPVAHAANTVETVLVRREYLNCVEAAFLVSSAHNPSPNRQQMESEKARDRV